jgi:hypothetical protein
MLTLMPYYRMIALLKENVMAPEIGGRQTGRVPEIPYPQKSKHAALIIP